MSEESVISEVANKEESKEPFYVDFLREISKGIKGEKGRPIGIMVIPWNGETRKFFDKGKKPKLGHKYVFVCRAFDGNKATFTLEGL